MAITHHGMVNILLVVATGCLLFNAHVDANTAMENPDLFEGDIIVTPEDIEQEYGIQLDTDVRINYWFKCAKCN